MTIKALALALGITPQALGQRLNRLGWTWDEAVSTPKGTRGRPRGSRSGGVAAECRAAGVARATYYARRKTGLSHVQALKAKTQRRAT